MGRFLQTDPIGSSSDVNLYAYGGGDPANVVDPTGQFAFPWHFGITFVASLRSGNGFLASVRYAWQSMVADFGTQSTKPSDTAIHAMAGMVGGVPQSVESARAMNQPVVADNKASGRLGVSAHATQDRYPKGHAGYKVWNGFAALGVIGAIKHLWNDLFPSPAEVHDAYTATVDMFAGAKVSSPANAPSSSGTRLPGGGCSCTAPIDSGLQLDSMLGIGTPGNIDAGPNMDSGPGIKAPVYGSSTQND